MLWGSRHSGDGGRGWSEKAMHIVQSRHEAGVAEPRQRSGASGRIRACLLRHVIWGLRDEL